MAFKAQATRGAALRRPRMWRRNCEFVAVINRAASGVAWDDSHTLSGHRNWAPVPKNVTLYSWLASKVPA